MDETDQIDQGVLEFVAVHEAAVAQQVMVLLGRQQDDAVASLERLHHAGLVSRVRLSVASPATYRVTPAGARSVDRHLPAFDELDLRTYRHGMTLGWLWLAARDGAFGQLRGQLSRRQMQAADSAETSRELLDGTGGLSFGAPLVGGGDDLPSYPDLALVLPFEQRGWIAVHAQLWMPEPVRLQALVGRYTAETAVRRVLFMVDERERIGEIIREIIGKVDQEDKVRVQMMAQDLGGGSARTI